MKRTKTVENCEFLVVIPQSKSFVAVNQAINLIVNLIFQWWLPSGEDVRLEDS
jgi:hypothetical protein